MEKVEKINHAKSRNVKCVVTKTGTRRVEIATVRIVMKKEPHEESQIKNRRKITMKKRISFFHKKRPLVLSKEDAIVFYEALEKRIEPTESWLKALKNYNSFFQKKTHD